MLSTYSESLVQAFLFQQSCILHRDMHNPYNSMLNLQQNVMNLACSGHWCQVSRLFVLLFILIFHHFLFWMLLNAAWKLGVLVSRKGVGEWRPQWMEGKCGKYHLVCQKPTHFDSWTVGERIIGVLHLILHKYIYVTIPLVALCLQRCVNLLFQSVFFFICLQLQIVQVVVTVATLMCLHHEHSFCSFITQPSSTTWNILFSLFW